ncbi:hypothetical protein PIB30_003276 [Stylosanthes scabra]|uniref:Uncharacterized protein n=1 Tax=Stylosanthes scabra TaxID=79078 RepID=A0ABU6S3T5_9FABA|nr:hypothetical protein [Stylosanthes scabra]
MRTRSGKHDQLGVHHFIVCSHIRVAKYTPRLGTESVVAVAVNFGEDLTIFPLLRWCLESSLVDIEVPSSSSCVWHLAAASPQFLARPHSKTSHGLLFVVLCLLVVLLYFTIHRCCVRRCAPLTCSSALAVCTSPVATCCSLKLVNHVAVNFAFVTTLCVGAPLAINVEAVKSPFGASILLLIFGFHLAAFIADYIISGFIFCDSPDVKALQRIISFETEMQSSLLALALIYGFFEDSLSFGRETEGLRLN